MVQHQNGGRKQQLGRLLDEHLLGDRAKSTEFRLSVPHSASRVQDLQEPPHHARGRRSRAQVAKAEEGLHSGGAQEVRRHSGGRPRTRGS